MLRYLTYPTVLPMMPLFFPPISDGAAIATDLGVVELHNGCEPGSNDPTALMREVWKDSTSGAPKLTPPSPLRLFGTCALDG